ncbi:MAG: transcription elongation factor GreAB [Rickettsiales bacterium]|nr:MAG: transcription elongation factor GreAB [Rickettsiales bacterium]
MTRKLNLGEIWLADLGSKLGTELGKLRPVLIIQNQTLLDANHPSSLVIPLTTNLIDDAEPLRIRINAQGKLDRDSDLLIDQIRAIDNTRLHIGALVLCNEDFMKKVYQAIAEVIGDKNS